MPASVIIPALDEAKRVGAAVESAFAAGAAEVIVVDGGSSDDTVHESERRGARVILAGRMRARQLNRGAEEARFEHLIFLHADTTLPPLACEAVVRALAGGSLFGGFRLRFEERSAKLRVAERMINLRTRLTRCPWGDQAQFIRRTTFLGLGGYLEIPLMEDYDLAVRMKRTAPTRILPLAVTTSGRRFLEKGVMRTAFTNWRIVIAYRMGTDPEQLARMYRG